MEIRNILTAAWEERDTWKFIDLSGKHLGVRMEALAPGGRSSIHHYHSREEEHVLLLRGDATLVLGEDELPLKEGDHVWFEAGVEVAHHLENRSATECRLLVFGERDDGDVVVYPERGVMMVKALGWKQYEVAARTKAVQEE